MQKSLKKHSKISQQLSQKPLRKHPTIAKAEKNGPWSAHGAERGGHLRLFFLNSQDLWNWGGPFLVQFTDRYINRQTEKDEQTETETTYRQIKTESRQTDKKKNRQPQPSHAVAASAVADHVCEQILHHSEMPYGKDGDCKR